ncbi:TIGR03087 family PEP-CTERM/XrtA system glycosyltransferase [Qipengyuania nanhaisediminis]|uniref:TIGR03087 family PEP-CTERM/XrtA system glycosyltransferase n=1 Tax=Qipengyuania nanhaisediminis TaxID=604088 RepID=UPI0038B2FB15
MGDILFLAHRVPFPPNRGDKIRAHHLLRKLAEIAPVHVGCFADSDEDRAAIGELSAIAASHCVVDRTKPLVLAGVEAICTRRPVSLTAFSSHTLSDWTRRMLTSGRIDKVVIFSGQMGQFLPGDWDGKVVIDLCDVDSAKFENFADNGDRVWLNRREGRLLAREEERLARRADATVLISAQEADLFASRLSEPGCANIAVIGNGIDAAAFDPTSIKPCPELAGAKGPHLVFTGQMDYPPNEAAAQWAATQLMPLLRERLPDACLHVVGRRPRAALRALDGRDGLRVWGEVPDIRPFLAAADCVVVPLAIARGVQNKVLEAMAMARPVLLTPQSATGIAARDAEHWQLADLDPSQMAAKAADLLARPEVAAETGQRARQFVLDHHDWQAMLVPLANLLEGGRASRHAA